MPTHTTNGNPPAGRAKAARRPKSIPADLPGEGGYSILRAIEQHRGLLTVKDLADIFGISAKAVYPMIERGHLPELTLPGCGVKRFDPATVSRWLRTHNRSLATR